MLLRTCESLISLLSEESTFDMVKRDHKPQASQPQDITLPGTTDVSALRQEADLWYRLQVLLHDLSNVAKDPSAEKRICSTTNELYISEPYFTDAEAIRIRTAIVNRFLKSLMPFQMPLLKSRRRLQLIQILTTHPLSLKMPRLRKSSTPN